MINEVIAKSVLTKHNDGFPTLWDVNPYRGCTIGCKYCFAQYSHSYVGLDNFFSDILVKTNVWEQLYRELKKKSWKREQIKLGGISDTYQHAESKYELMPKIFDILKRTKNPVFIQTKSTLILRDFEIIKELAKCTPVDISASISTFDEKTRKILEPGAAPTMERMEMLQEFNKICRNTVVAFIPIIPLISDDPENLDTAFRLTKEFDLDVIVASPLHLRNAIKADFISFIQTKFPEFSDSFANLYKRSILDPVYATNLLRNIDHLRSRYQLYKQYSIVDNVGNKQLNLF